MPDRFSNFHPVYVGGRRNFTELVVWGRMVNVVFHAPKRVQLVTPVVAFAAGAVIPTKPAAMTAAAEKPRATLVRAGSFRRVAGVGVIMLRKSEKDKRRL